MYQLFRINQLTITMSQPTKITDWFRPSNQVQSESTDDYTLHFHGESIGNPGPGGCGWVIRKGETELNAGWVAIDYCTNNYAEYEALKHGLKSALGFGYRRLSVYGDSILVINQVTGVWQCNSTKLAPILKWINELKSDFEEIEFLHVSKEDNARADVLANQAIEVQDT